MNFRNAASFRSYEFPAADDALKRILNELGRDRFVDIV